MNALLSLRRRQRLLSWLTLLLLTALVGYRQVAAQFAAAPATELVAGSYAGTVAVSEPAPLGDLDLLLEITSANGQLTGKVNPIKTQVFLGGPTFTGSVTTNGVVTPTVRIESQIFSGEVSGRTVERHFVLTGEVLNNGDTLRGEYTEIIVGFKPHPMAVKGAFLLARPNGVTAILSVPTPRGTPAATPTTPSTGGGAPTPTATSTPPAGSSDGMKLYLPFVQRAAVVALHEEGAAGVGEANSAAAAPTFTPTATSTPTPLALDASSVLTRTELQHQIHLPLIMR